MGFKVEIVPDSAVRRLGLRRSDALEMQRPRPFERGLGVRKLKSWFLPDFGYVVVIETVSLLKDGSRLIQAATVCIKVLSARQCWCSANHLVKSSKVLGCDR